MTTIQTIVTHDGPFHADDVFAVAALAMTREFRGVPVIRTRDKTEIANATIVVDVGFTYDPMHCRFDHHQSNGPKRADGTPYSAFGLVWKAYGKHAVQHGGGIAHESDAIEIARIIDEGLVRSIDLCDNGMIESRPYDIESLIGAMNALPAAAITENFDRAVEIAKTILAAQIARSAQVVTDRIIVECALAARGAEDPVLELPISCEHWRAPICAHNAAFPHAPILFVLQERAGQWGATGVPPNPDSRAILAPFPSDLGGLSEDEFVARGLPDVIFVHRNLFFAISHTCEATMDLIAASLEQRPSS